MKPSHAWFAIGLVAAPLALALHASRPESASVPAWSTVSAEGFLGFAESLGLGLRTGDRSLSEDDVRGWIDALGTGEGEVPTRAAVLLGIAAADAPRAVAERAERALVAVLGERAAAGGRELIGRTIVAARALAGAAGRDVAIRGALVDLATGQAPHPDLAVRVECAAVVAEAGHATDVLDFLLSVLRAETPDQERSAVTWPRMTTLAWVKTRAAEGLSKAAGTQLRFHPDAPWAHQTTEANRLEGLLR